MKIKLTVYKETGKYYTHEIIEVDETKYQPWEITYRIEEILQETIGNKYSDMFIVCEPINSECSVPCLVKPCKQ